MTTLSSIWRPVILILAVVPLAYYVAATLAAWRFFRRERALVLPNFTPPASLLKPVRGVDFGSRANFESFCRQDYPNYEILFAVGDAADPAVPLIQRLIADFPQRQIRLFIGVEDLGTNRKVNKLVRLAREARHDVLVVTDGDVRVGANYLREVMAPLANEKVGAVTSFYRGIAERNFGAYLEAIGASSDFFAGVLMAEWVEGVKFALGASIVTTKRWVSKIGGFESLTSTLADDYELGRRIAGAGGQVLLSREVVCTMYPAQSMRSFWEHQVRWSRTVRLCRPVSYIGLLFTHALPFCLLAAFVAPAHWVAATYVVGYLVLRLVMAWTVGVWGVDDKILRRKIWLVPLRDLLQFVVWLASFASNRITWAGEEYMIVNGKMVKIAQHNSAGADTAQQTHL